jgi:alanine-glyoxylate transaminase/serine-glyoxylate transaminase/serine-pyruvate transaminase
METHASFSPPERVLMGPGPSNVHYRVLQAMAAPTIGHLDPQFLCLMEDVQNMLRWLLKTKNRLTIPISGTGSAGMETCLANAFERGEKVLICVNGVFGKRMTEVAKRYGLIPVPLEKPWGEVCSADEIKTVLNSQSDIVGIALVHAETSTGACQPLEEIGALCKERNITFLVDAVTSLGGIPIEVDNWNIDACYSGTQKCISCPPGLSPVTFSEKAVEGLTKRKTSVESWYLDLTLIRQYWGTERVYHHTAPINMIYALYEALILLQEEGLEHIYQRHKLNSRALLTGLQAIGIEPFVAEQFRLPELNSVTIPVGIDDKYVRSALLNQYSIEIGAGLGPLAGKIWRIGLMGQSSTQRNVIYFLNSLEEILYKLDYVKTPGAAISAAEKVYMGIHSYGTSV